jgi:hypothetical protein
VSNLERAIVERVFLVKGPKGELVPPPLPKPGHFKRTLRDVERALEPLLPRIRRVAAEDFLSLCPAQKRKLYSDAIDSLSRCRVRRKDSYVSAFVKKEKLWRQDERKDLVPRLIQPRHPRYNVELGRYIKPLEPLMYKALDRLFGSPTVAKGWNAAKTGRICAEKWAKFVRPVGVGLDASRFDQHCSVQALRWEHKQYLKCFPTQEREHLKTLLAWQRHYKGIGRADDGVVKYERWGCRCSGDMNTALGNCLLMCSMIWQYCHNQSLKFELLNNGDDCVLIVEEEELHKLDGMEQYFLGLGYEMKIEEPVRKLERIVFCQTSPVWTPDGYIMVRCPWSGIAKDSCTLMDIRTIKDVRRWITAVGQGGLALAGGIPLYDALYRAYLREGKGVSLKKWLQHPLMDSGFFRMSRGMDRRHCAIHPDTRVSFYYAFGIMPSIQVEIENMYSEFKLTRGPVDSEEHSIFNLDFLCPDYVKYIPFNY